MTLVAACAAGVGGSLVAAQSTSTIQGCVSNTGALRITSDPTGFHANACSSFEHAVSINQTGPPGVAGPVGPAGPVGSTGAAGAKGLGAPGAVPPTVNFIAAAAFTMPSEHYVRAEIDCPKGDLATGGSAAVVSPLGESPAFDSPSPGPGVVGVPGHPAVAWMAEASNTAGQSASLRITAVCAGPATNGQTIGKRRLLSRPLRKAKAKTS